MLFSRLFAISSLALLAHSQDPATTSLSPAEASQAVDSLNAYFSSLTTQPEYSTAASILSTALPTSVSSEMINNPNGFYESLATQTSYPDWYTALPTTVQDLLESVGQHEISIITEAIAGSDPTPVVTITSAVSTITTPMISVTSSVLSGPAPTNAVRVAGAVVVAGGAVVAIL